ncbi:hypothetical protein Tco_0352508 [Tanacetum coccineum]
MSSTRIKRIVTQQIDNVIKVIAVYEAESNDPSTMDRSYARKRGDEALMIQDNRSGGYASIVASEQRAELFDRIGTLERDNMRLKGMLGVERQRVDRLRRSM